MDEWTKKHLRKWLAMQFEREINFYFNPMIAIFDEDPEYWSGQNYWRLYDAAKQKVGDFPREMANLFESETCSRPRIDGGV